MAIIFNPFDGQLAQHPDYSAEFAKLDSIYYIPTSTKIGPSTYSASAGEEVRCDTITNGSFTVSLPTAENRESVKIIDIKGVDSITGFGTNTLTVSPQAGDTIMGNSDLVVDVGATKLVLMYNDSDTDWKIVDLDSPQFTNLEWSSILGKPTYGTTSSIDLNLTGTIDNYVVEGDLVDNGVELNHLSSVIQASLALADTALQPGDIGVTVQGYSADTVIDANYVATENSYTTTEKNKLAGIASGAEVNVQSDWDATSGDAQILNKPTVYTTTNSATPPVGAIEGDTWWDSETGEKFIYYNDGDTLQWVQVSNTNNLVLADVGTAAYADVEDFIPSADSGNYVQTTGDQSIAGTKTFTTALILPNNSRINGVEHFYQTSKPTVRDDGSALVIGDRWWKTDDGTEWFWNGTYWLSGTQFQARRTITGISAANIPWGAEERLTKTGGTIFAETLTHNVYGSGADPANNYWNYTIGLKTAGAITKILFSGDTSSLSFGVTASIDTSINTAYTLATLENGLAISTGAKVGSPSNLGLMTMLYYREVFPG